MTLKETYVKGLLARGERLVKQNFKHDVYSRAKGGFYYVGRAGSLRVGKNLTSSIPCSQAFKDQLAGMTRHPALSI